LALPEAGSQILECRVNGSLSDLAPLNDEVSG